MRPNQGTSPLQHNPTPTYPHKPPIRNCHYGYRLPLSRTARHNEYILVMCDHFTKWVELYAMPNQEAKTVADRIVSFACRHGIPKQIISDQGIDFQSQLVDEVFEVLDVHRLRKSPFHPQTDGLSERTTRTVKQILNAFIIDNPAKEKQWDKQLEKVVLAYNSATHSTTKVSPFRAPWFPAPHTSRPHDRRHSHQPEPVRRPIRLYRQMQDVYKTVQTNRNTQVDRARIRCERLHRAAANYYIGDHVWLLNEANPKGQPKAYKRQWKGPY
jgi:hypothetical protein